MKRTSITGNITKEEVKLLITNHHLNFDLIVDAFHEIKKDKERKKKHKFPITYE